MNGALVLNRAEEEQKREHVLILLQLTVVLNVLKRLLKNVEPMSVQVF